jgi:hypothetical protein
VTGKDNCRQPAKVIDAGHPAVNEHIHVLNGLQHRPSKGVTFSRENEGIHERLWGTLSFWRDILRQSLLII